ncbi:MAG TPA: asparaginase [Bacillota bacterium]|nr:asparaginase [Bacillota bacterium]
MDHSIEPIKVYRGKYIESTHDVHVAVVNAEGELLAYYGDPHRLTFARSSMKPLQAIPVVESGALEAFDITEKELALFTASHSGEPFHRESVADILEKINLSEDKLQCGTHIPKDIESYKSLIRDGGELTPFYSNCSGKHSGMLTGCVQQDLDIATYRELSHPYQQQIIDCISEVGSYPKEKIVTSVDGCGVPVHRMPLDHLAMAFGRLACPEKWTHGDETHKQSLARIRDAMIHYPEMVAGTKRYDTDLMKAFGNRIVAKGGAEGVHCYGDVQTGIGVAIKAADGNARATNVASMDVLKQMHIGDATIWDKLAVYSKAPVLNARDETIGEVIADFKLSFL